MVAGEHVFGEDYYARLGLRRDASDADVRRAYRALIRTYTPEREPEAFKRIRQAYETLSSADARQEYDRRPDIDVAAPLKRGRDAMDREDYATAEIAFKQVLVIRPS